MSTVQRFYDANTEQEWARLTFLYVGRKQ